LQKAFAEAIADPGVSQKLKAMAGQSRRRDAGAIRQDHQQRHRQVR